MTFNIDEIIRNSKNIRYNFTHDILKNIDLEYSRYYMEDPSYYALMTSIAQLYPEAQFVELGTSAGASSVAYLYGNQNPSKKIYTYDILLENKFIHDGLKDRIIARKADVTTCDFSDIGKIDFLFIDISHNGDDEAATLRNLEKQGILKDCMVMFDDIHLNPEMKRLWDGIEADVKIDITKDGHVTGTGVILIN